MLISLLLRFSLGSEVEDTALMTIGEDGETLGLSVETMSRSPNPWGSIPSVITLMGSPGKVSFGHRCTAVLE